MQTPSAFAPPLQALLQAVPGDLPAGPSMRYDPAYLAIRTAREEEDPNLPLREWSRPLKKADWRAVDQLASDILGRRSKDFQVAAWLAEAWTRRYHLAGLQAAVQLLTGLVESYWDSAHPQLEADDDEARVAPFIWLNENLPRVLLLHVPLLHLPERHPGDISLLEWDKALELENRKVVTKKGAVAPVNALPTRSEIMVAANGANLEHLMDLRAQLQHVATAWQGLVAALDLRMEMRAPSMAKLPDLVRRMERACDTLIDGRVRVAAPAEDPPQPSQESSMPPTSPPPAPPVPLSAAVPAPATVRAGPISNREDAYRMLEEVAQYLLKAEPHSPTPYLVMRAVSWGRMSLADLMQEIVRQEGDINRYFSLLGIQKPRD